MEDRGVREQTSSSPIKAILFHRCPRGPSDPTEGDAQEKECHRERNHGDNQRTDPLRLSEFFEVLKSDPEDDTCPSNHHEVYTHSIVPTRLGLELRQRLRGFRLDQEAPRLIS